MLLSGTAQEVPFIKFAVNMRGTIRVIHVPNKGINCRNALICITHI